MTIEKYITRQDLKTVTGLGLVAWLFTFTLDLLVLGDLSIDIRYYILKYVGFLICIILSYQFKLKEIVPRDKYWWVFFIAYPLMIFINASGTNIVTKQLGDYGLEAVFKVKSEKDSVKKQVLMIQENILQTEEASLNVFRFLSFQNTWWPDIKLIGENKNLNDDIALYQNELKSKETELAAMGKQLADYKLMGMEVASKKKTSLPIHDSIINSIKLESNHLKRVNDSLLKSLQKCTLIYERCVAENEQNKDLATKNMNLQNRNGALKEDLKILIRQIKSAEIIQSRYAEIKSQLTTPEINAEDRYRKIMLLEFNLNNYIGLQDSLLQFPFNVDYKISKDANE